MPFFAEWYVNAISPDGKPFERREFMRKQMEILGTLQIMGPDLALEAMVNFCELAQKGMQKDHGFDAEAFHRSFTRLNYCLCCEIHGERPDNQH